MKKLTPQQEKILELHRGMDWVCSTSYEFIRDHRKRISELNTGYLKEKGYQLVAKPCDGRCGKSHNSAVAMRRAEKIGEAVLGPKEQREKDRLESIAFFDSYQPTP